MSKLIEVTDFFNGSTMLINTRFIIRCIALNHGVPKETEITLQYGDQVVQHKVKESMDRLYDLTNYEI